MTSNEMQTIIGSILPKETSHFDPPSTDDWKSLKNKFGCEFGDDFKSFINLMSSYAFPGDIYNVSTGRTNGNDSIELVYDSEMATAVWDEHMIPFYGIGNGDYFVLNSTRCPSSPVYYYYAERGNYEEYSPVFDAWIKQLPEFLK